MLNQETILNSLKSIIDPDLHKDIVTLGFVKNITIDKGDVSFDIALTTPACPIKEEFKNKAQEAVKKIPGVASVKVNMTSLNTPKPFFSTDASPGLDNIGSIIAVSSCKGGVGKSTVAAHMATELARRGFKVGLADCDIHGPSVPALFDLQNEGLRVNNEKQFVPIEKNKLKIMSFGFLLGDAPAVMRGPIVSRYIQQILLNTAWGELDYLFLDMPPGTGDIQLTITQSVRLSGAVIVTTPQTLSLVDVSRGILMFEKVNVPILGIIENMSYFICDQCDKKHYIFGRQGSLTLRERFGIDILAEWPILPQMIHKINQPLANDYIMQAVDKTIMALGKSSILQKQIPEIQVEPKDLLLKWRDGTSLRVSHRGLRLSCRCALCADESTGEVMLKENDIRADIAPTEITPLGNYALGITWNDGHASGIYPYETIKKLAKIPAVKFH